MTTTTPPPGHPSRLRRAARGSVGGRPGAQPPGMQPPAARRPGAWRPGAQRPTGLRSGRGRAAPWLFLAPALVLFALFFALPIAYAVVLSFRTERVRGPGVGRRVEVFAGWENYATALGDPRLWEALGRLLVYGLIVVPVMLALATLFALLLDLPTVRWSRFSRTAIFLPYAVPGVIATLLWGFLYLPALSPFTDLAAALGLPEPDFFGEGTVLGSIANIAVWGGLGFTMVVLSTALRAQPPELYEAARVDGCSEWQVAWRVKLPLLAPALVMTGLFAVVATLQVYSEPATLAPLSNTIPSTYVPLMKVFADAFQNDDLYAATATSVLLAVLALVVSLALLRVLRDRAFAGEDR